MGSHAPYCGSHNESALVSNQNRPTIPDMRSKSNTDIDDSNNHDSTNHQLLPDQPPVPKSVPNQNKSRADIVVI